MGLSSSRFWTGRQHVCNGQLDIQRSERDWMERRPTTRSHTPFPIGSYGGGVVVESAPIVASTTPSDGAGGVALDANIEINFQRSGRYDRECIHCLLYRQW